MNKVILLVLCISLSQRIGADNKLVDNMEKKIESLYQGVTGFNISEEEANNINNKGGASTYGEITYQSAKKILDDLNIIPSDVFYDLGSGIGKLNIQVFLTTPVKKVVGIELSPTRFKYAHDIQEKLKKEGAIKNSRILSFLKEDITQADLSDATIIYMCSTCFSDELMKKLLDKLSKLKKGLKVITLKKFPENKVFNLIKSYTLPMTWSTNTTVYLYKLL